MPGISKKNSQIFYLKRKNSLKMSDFWPLNDGCLFVWAVGWFPLLYCNPPPIQVLHLLSGLKSKSSEICIKTNAPSNSSNTTISSPNSINSKTNLPWLVRGEYGSNTPWLFLQVFKPYSPMPCQWCGSFMQE